jgi:hypothetical protein
MLQGKRIFMTVGKLILSELAPLVSRNTASFYHHECFRTGSGDSSSWPVTPTAEKRQ